MDKIEINTRVILNNNNSKEATLIKNPFRDIKIIPDQIYATYNGEIVGSVYVFPILIKTNNNIIIGNGGSTLFVNKEKRGLGIGKKLAYERLNISPNKVSILAGLSSMSYPLYTKLGCKFFYSKRIGYINNSGPILTAKFGKYSKHIIPHLVNFLLRLFYFPYSLSYKKLSKKYNVIKVNNASERIEEIATNSLLFQELHTKEWFNWHINNTFFNTNQDYQALYEVHDENAKTIAFFMVKIRTKEINNNKIKIISLIEWGIAKESSLSEKDIIILLIHEMKKLNPDIIEVSFLDKNLMKHLEKTGFFFLKEARIGIYVGEDSPLRKYSGFNIDSNWRLRPAYSDYGLS